MLFYNAKLDLEDTPAVNMSIANHTILTLHLTLGTIVVVAYCHQKKISRRLVFWAHGGAERGIPAH